jgi:hypothetical protein
MRIKKRRMARCQWLILVILVTQEAKIRNITVQSQPREIVYETLSKMPNTKQCGGVVRVVECLPSKNEALSSNSCAAKKKRKSM